eukprot:maker-scaffold_34-snap-gene-2.42-mRNA-1 protein AED:0.25 eAED:0.25 QI:0/0/0/1/1/1/2/0/177
MQRTVNSVCGLVISNHSIITEWQQISDSKLQTSVFLKENPAQLCFFLFPGALLNNQQALALYFAVSPFDNWTILDFLSFENPSVFIQRPLSGVVKEGQNVEVKLGVSVENLSEMKRMNLQDRKEKEIENIALKIATDLINFIGSFSQTTQFGEKLVVPPNALDRWLQKFKRKLKFYL